MRMRVVAFLMMLTSPAAHACMAEEPLWSHLGNIAGLRDVRAAAVEVAGSATTRALTLRATERDRYAWVSIPAPAGGWDLAARRAVEATMKNVGAEPVEVLLWVVADAGWESIADVAVLQPRESRMFSCGLRKTFPDGTPKLDPTRVRGIQVMLKHPQAGQAVEVTGLVAAGLEPPWVRPPGKLDVPTVEEGPPAAGRWRGLHCCQPPSDRVGGPRPCRDPDRHREADDARASGMVVGVTVFRNRLPP